MTVREVQCPQTGGAARWLRGLLVTLCAVLAVLLHHELPGSPLTTMSAAAPHAMTGPAPVPAAHHHTGSPAAGTAAHGSHGAACPSMAMQLCAAPGVSTVQLAAPPESPAPGFPAQIAALARVGVARSATRAPPDLSFLSQLRI
ncbi:DUF6153 family protein [Streptomyces sp. F001]|uniref:DUF6153 family protein n=1 Tax=Streptomyces sp. F001 TaxID=1510026 RepID=UPI001F1029D1|nr:DUF6153 family protein [Streptomyces sp. F001]